MLGHRSFIKNSVGSNFPKTVRRPHLIQKSLPKEEKGTHTHTDLHTHTHTHTQLSKCKKGMW